MRDNQTAGRPFKLTDKYFLETDVERNVHLKAKAEKKSDCK